MLYISTSYDLPAPFYFCRCLSTSHCLLFFIPSSSPKNSWEPSLLTGSLGWMPWLKLSALVTKRNINHPSTVSRDFPQQEVRPPVTKCRFYKAQPNSAITETAALFTLEKKKFYPQPVEDSSMLFFFFKWGVGVFPLKAGFSLYLSCWLLYPTESMIKARNSVYCHMNSTEADRDFVKIWQALQWKVLHTVNREI